MPLASKKEIDLLLAKQEVESLSNALSQSQEDPELVRAKQRSLLADPGYQAARQERRLALIAAKKSEVYADLRARLNRPGDPYELLEKKSKLI